jgi:uncharacterized protein (DUF433 family)/DNA-binding transcriptional MerR regulator
MVRSKVSIGAHWEGKMQQTKPFLGLGLYSIPEARRLTGIPAASLRRWLVGYTYRDGDHRHPLPPVVDSSLEPIEGVHTLTFLDLLEARFIAAFRQHGISLQAIRLAASRGQELFDHSHPFSTRGFRTDGQTIFAEIADDAGDPVLLDLLKRQFAFREVLGPYLYAGIEFSENNEPTLWRPVPKIRAAVLDPRRQFGQPILEEEGVPTEVLARAFRTEGSVQRVAQWFEVKASSVRAAVRFEEELDQRLVA